MITPFPIHVPDDNLADLRDRLDRTRLPEPATDDSQGIGLDRLRSLLDVLRGHDWRALERRWNAIPHFRARVDGLGVAFWHVRSPEPGALPLVLTHGWPGSVLEFEDLIGPLTDPVAHGAPAADAFHLVVPALPGFGFSERPAEPGWNVGRTARAWATLMSELGYPRFGVHGGDWGSHVSTELARIAPDRVVGLHSTMPLAAPLPADLATTDPAERRIIEKRELFMRGGIPHVMFQGARPQTFGYSLVDSPAGLAAWLGEHLDAFAENHGVSQERQVDTIALYWFTATGAATARWYWENLRWGPRTAEEMNAQPVTVPAAFTLFPGEPHPTARRWAERRYRNIVAWHEMDRGGHFPGWERPGTLVAELRDAFRHARGR
ncbi:MULTISPECIES: epoxide hydrolase family protein [Catenuloplanes]|uniref:Pimeloyl-ACP methyl ester carboxylesterase n=1 Tax=Catenuloplanes niger TaxID=587534 RepID=A0AAE3ZYT6_9ACTN|nr:epoxide hydrolase [Catenuloplanes niger]MDR7326265.1 pimeloyl-ACP methyl ester carboxylesterase [Catenuloplanes niger]